MIRFTHLGVEYGIQFRHITTTAGDLALPDVYPGDPRRVTEATIVETHTLTPVLTGMAICHEVDCFVKDIGRRVSLTDALELEPDRSFRKAAWEAYFAR